jgi:hypothetical protein
MTRRITRTVTIAIATAALVAPTALARPADAPPAVAKAAADADAAKRREEFRLARAEAYPTRPAQADHVSPRPDTATSALPSDRDVAWTTLVLVIVAGLLVLAAIGGIIRHARAGGRSGVAV